MAKIKRETTTTFIKPPRAVVELSVELVKHVQPDDDGMLPVPSPTHQTALHTNHISA